jgi:ADP-ribose pyrophosphatase YjhB (NUDIX family)
VGLYSAPERDPRGWDVSEAYAALADECALAKAGDDAEDAVWFDISTTGVPPVQGEKRPLRKIVLSTDEEEYELVYAIEEGPLSRIPRSRVVDSAGLAFDHAQIICDTWLRVVKEIGKNGIEG